MTFDYDAEADILRIVFKDVAIDESDEGQPGVIVDYDAEGNVVGVEVLDAIKRKTRILSPHPKKLENDPVHPA